MVLYSPNRRATVYAHTLRPKPSDQIAKQTRSDVQRSVAKMAFLSGDKDQLRSRWGLSYGPTVGEYEGTFTRWLVHEELDEA